MSETTSDLILVTGGTGFLGRHLIKQLRATTDTPIRVLARSFDTELADLGVELMEGSMTRTEDIIAAVEGVTHVYHLAGRVERDASKAHAMYDLHVEGTRHLLDALRGQKGVKKIVVASTSGTVGVSKDSEQIANDDSSHAEHIVHKWPYYLSKIYTERLCMRFVEEHSMPIVLMRPTLLLGPGDVKQSSTGDVVLFLQKKIPAPIEGGLSFVDVRDVADAFIAAMEKAPAGRTYLLGAENLTMESFFKRLEHLTGIRAPWIPIPGDAMLFGAKLLGQAMKLIGKDTDVDPVSVEMAQHYWYIDSSRAIEELDFAPRSGTETLRDTIRWIEQYHPEFATHIEREKRQDPISYVPQETLDYARKLQEERES